MVHNRKFEERREGHIVISGYWSSSCFRLTIIIIDIGSILHESFQRLSCLRRLNPSPSTDKKFGSAALRCVSMHNTTPKRQSGGFGFGFADASDSGVVRWQKGFGGGVVCVQSSDSYRHVVRAPTSLLCNDTRSLMKGVLSYSPALGRRHPNIMSERTTPWTSRRPHTASLVSCFTSSPSPP